MRKLFVNLENIVGTAYWEFASGSWDKKTYRCTDSIYIHDGDIFHSDFFDIVLDIIPECDPLGETKISKEQWKQICEKAILGGGHSAQIVYAAEPWIIKNFQKHDVFYILGV